MASKILEELKEFHNAFDMRRSEDGGDTNILKRISARTHSWDSYDTWTTLYKNIHTNMKTNFHLTSWFRY